LHLFVDLNCLFVNTIIYVNLYLFISNNARFINHVVPVITVSSWRRGQYSSSSLCDCGSFVRAFLFSFLWCL